MLRDNICNAFELKKFVFSILNENISAFDLARFIECKSNFKYTIIEIKFLQDSFKTLEENIKSSVNINKIFREKWRSIDIPMIKLF